MEKTEYMNILEKHIDAFDFNKRELEYLFKTPIESMGLMEDRIYKITPVLDQICTYALGGTFFNDLELECIPENGLGFDAVQVMQGCIYYMDDLLKSECKHPTVLIYNDLINGSNLYNTIMEDVSNSVELLDGDIKEKLTNFLENVDEKILKYKATSYNVVESSIQKINTKKTMLKLFGEYGRKRALTELLVATAYASYNCGNDWCKVYADKSGDPSFTLEFVNLIKLIEENLPYIEDEFDYYEYDDEDEDEPGLCEYFNEIKEAYFLHKSVQYDYLKNSYKEARLLQKCKKM